MRIPPERSAYQLARRQRAGNGGSPLLRYVLVLLGGALSMLVPVDSTCSLRGQLHAASAGEATVPHATVRAQPAQCALLGYDEPASVAVDAPGQESALFEAEIVRLSPHAAREGGATHCEIELALLPKPDEPERLRELPPGAALSVVFAAEPRSWLAVLVDQLTGDGKVGEATVLVRRYARVATQYARSVVDSARGTGLGHAATAEPRPNAKPGP